MTLDELVKLIDHTNVTSKASCKDIKHLCDEAKRYKFGCVCVNSFYVKYAVKLLRGFNIAVAATCGFPLGAVSEAVKQYEVKKAILDGAKEIDMVINLGALKSRKYKVVEDDIKGVARICRKNKVLCKVILEMNLLSRQEKVKVCKIACRAEADILKTGTGMFGPAKVADVRLMRKTAGSKVGIKAAGGIRDYKQVEDFIKAGATRIGTSAGADILRDFRGK
jgi:deoxyribose-phosphate aldolase